MADGTAGTEALDPVATLRRIAFLMERRLADSYRIKAYRGAVSTLLACPPGEGGRHPARDAVLDHRSGLGADAW